MTLNKYTERSNTPASSEALEENLIISELVYEHIGTKDIIV